MSDVEQGTEEWRRDRAGCITASRFADAIAMDKRNPGKPTEARNKYLRQIVAEILSGTPLHQVDSKSLSWGKEMEPKARREYEIRTGEFVERAGFVLHPEYEFIGCSPDGLCGDDGGLEMKCPYAEDVHIKTLIDGMPPDHMAQVQGNMFVTGRQWWDFVSFRPWEEDKAKPYRIHIQRIPRDDAYIEAMRLALLQFWSDVQRTIQAINDRLEIK